MMDCKKITFQDADICIVRNLLDSKALLNVFDDKTLYETELARIGSESKKIDFLAVRYALKLCFDGVEHTISYSSQGKPFLLDNKTNISISHCKNWVAVMVNPTFDVGVDIELPTPKLLRVAKRFLSKDEFICYQSLDKEEAFRYLRIIWSAKEALFKIVGDAYNFSEQLHALPFDLSDSGRLRIVHIDTDKIYTIQYEITENYTLAYCLDHE